MMVRLLPFPILLLIIFYIIPILLLKKSKSLCYFYPILITFTVIEHPTPPPQKKIEKNPVNTKSTMDSFPYLSLFFLLRVGDTKLAS